MRGIDNFEVILRRLEEPITCTYPKSHQTSPSPAPILSHIKPAHHLYLS